MVDSIVTTSYGYITALFRNSSTSKRPFNGDLPTNWKEKGPKYLWSYLDGSLETINETSTLWRIINSLLVRSCALVPTTIAAAASVQLSMNITYKTMHFKATRFDGEFTVCSYWVWFKTLIISCKLTISLIITLSLLKHKFVISMNQSSIEQYYWSRNRLK